MSKQGPETKKTKKPLPGILSKKGVIPTLIVLLLAVYGFLGYTFYTTWADSREVFRSVTVELGTESLSLRDFMTDKANAKRASFVSDPSVIDLSQVGTTTLVLKHGNEEHTVTLTVQDTIAPTANIPTEYAVSVNAPLPEASAIVTNVQDMSPVTVSFDQPLSVPEDYAPLTRTILLEDTSGNKTTQSCTLTFTGWVKDAVILELGTNLTADMILLDPEKDAAYVDQAQLDAVSAAGVGTHELTVSTGTAEDSCTVTIQDTTAPILTLNTLRKFPGEAPELSEFVSYTSDASGDPEITMTSEAPDYSVEGKYTITIEARDASGNATSKDTILYVATNLNPPEIKGADEELTIAKHSTPDLLSGVTAKDDIDGSCEVTVDTSTLDTSAAGTYYVTYSATDNSGNVGTCKRKIIVEHDEEDTAAMIKELAATLEDDPELIRDYVHDRIAYSHNWGGDDPVWYGLTTNTGNCYVHALTLQALLTEKGYETQLIWVTNESHYWLIIKLEEGWRHIDSTPSAQHEAIGLATDRVRYLNLNGRNWDRSKWPACN